MLLALFQWIDQMSALVRPALVTDSELCIAHAAQASAARVAAPASATRAPARGRAYWGHVPLSRLTTLHGVH